MRALVHPIRLLRQATRHLDLRSHPELALFPTEQHGRKAMRRAARKLVGRPAYFAAVLAAVTLSVTLTLVLRNVAASLGPYIGRLTLNLILAVPVMAACGLLALWLLKRHIAKLLRHELLDCGVPTCVGCGYHLIDLPGPNCPECGRPFDEPVREILEANKAEPSTV